MKILIEGYAKQLPALAPEGPAAIGRPAVSGAGPVGWVASSTTCLITSGGKRIITDPGCNREKLLATLASEGLRTSDIDYVFLSHQHPDHILLAGIFEKAKFATFDTNLLYDNDRMLEFDPHVLGTDIEILDTPGHVLEHLSLLVDTPKGKIAIAGDAIWWLADEPQEFRMDQPDHSQAKGMDLAKLIASRKKLLARADFVIPGHGRMFPVTAAMRNASASPEPNQAP